MNPRLRNARYHVMILILVVLFLGLTVPLLYEPGSASQKNWVVNIIIVLLTLMLNLALSWQSTTSSLRTLLWSACWVIYVLALTVFLFASQDVDTLVTAGSFVLVSCVAWYLYWATSSARVVPNPPDPNMESA
jgi:predicted ABC-type exoprotein transport system permease subunit